MHAMSMTARLVAEIMALLASHGPTSAYRLRILVESRWGKTVPPPLIYRALDRLSSQRRITRLSATRRYVIQDRSLSHAVALSCRACGRALLANDPSLMAEAMRLASANGFATELGYIEIVSHCHPVCDGEDTHDS